VWVCEEREREREKWPLELKEQFTLKKKAFADNLVKKKLRFLMKTFQDFLHIMDFIGNQTVHGPNDSFSAASKGFKRYQTINNCLI